MGGHDVVPQRCRGKVKNSRQARIVLRSMVKSGLAVIGKNSTHVANSSAAVSLSSDARLEDVEGRACT